MGGPFSRASALFALIAAAAGDMGKLAKIGPYRSRGHGRGSHSANHHKARSKYMPHQGKRECARRLGQLRGWV